MVMALTSPTGKKFPVLKELIDVIRQAWDEAHQDLPKYPAASMGPQEAFELLKKMEDSGSGNLINGIKNAV